jgi:uncharacterized protein (TIGR02444 family)
MPGEMTPPEKPDEAAFWSFSLAFYARPGVAEVCLGLQDEGGFDVNLVLLCCWVGWSGRGRLDAAALAAADRRVAGWRREVVERLRSVRRTLKTAPVAGAATLRGEVQALELRAEREAQRLILTDLRRAPGTADRLRDAAANLALYLGAGPAEAGGSATLVEALALL